jgi:hypothetical protein
MGQGTSHNHHVSGGPAHHGGDRPRSNGSGVNFGSMGVPGQWPHQGGGDMIKEGSPYDGQVNVKHR